MSTEGRLAGLEHCVVETNHQMRAVQLVVAALVRLTPHGPERTALIEQIRADTFDQLDPASHPVAEDLRDAVEWLLGLMAR